MKKSERAKKILLGVLLLLGAAGAILLLHIRLQQKQSVYQVKVDENALENQGEAQASYRKIEVDGQVYRYNTSITNILYMGVDTETDSEVETAGAPGQADSIMMLSIDRRTRRMEIIAIPRDTMTKIRMYDNSGNYLGRATQHLSLAYAYGDGKEQSCRLVSEAVSQLLFDIPVQKYISSDISSIAQINDLVGGVTVTVPGDDLEYLGTRFKKGRTLTLDDETAEIFVRSRDIDEDFSNTGRMERQKVYLMAFLEKLKVRAQDDMEGLLADIEELGDTSLSNLTSTDLDQLLTILSENDLTEENYHILEGEDQLGELHDEFYADEEKLQELILDLYYVKV